MATSGIFFESRTMRALSVALGGLVRRQSVIAENVANADTPGYLSKDVEFQAHLDAVLAKPPARPLERTHPAHFSSPADVRLVAVDAAHFSTASPASEPRLTQAETVTVGNDGNSVEVDREMVKLAETQLEFATLARIMSSRIEALRLMARDGR